MKPYLRKARRREAAAMVWGLLAVALWAGGTARAQPPPPYHVDATRSSVRFAVRHLGVLTVEGHFGEVAGTIGYAPHAPGTLHAEVAVRAASIDTGNRVRDRSLRSPAFLDVEAHPSITFTSTGPASPAPDGSPRLTGQLTLHGVTRRMALPYTLRPAPSEGTGSLHIHAVFTLNRRDYGLTFGPTMDALVGDEVRVTVHLVAVR